MSKAKEPRCPCLDESGTISFNWRIASAESLPEYRPLVASLRESKKLRAGFLFRCASCDQPWYLDDKAEMMHRVDRSRMDLIDRWSGAPVRMTPKQRRVLENIGGTPPDLYGNKQGILTFPCRISRGAGAVHDPAVVYLTGAPPLEARYGEVFLLSKSDYIEPTKFALSGTVRYGSTRAREVHMGFAPYPVVSRDGARFTLNGSTDLFAYQGYKGSDLSEDPIPFSFEKSGTIVNEPLPNPTLFWADLPEKHGDLRLTRSGRPGRRSPKETS